MAADIRTQAKAALFALGQSAVFGVPVNGQTSWVTTSQRLKLWTQVPADQRPAMFLVQHREDYERKGTGLPARRYLECGFWCYAVASDDAPGDPILDTFEGALEAVLAPQPGNITGEQLLGGVLAPGGWCRIDKASNMFIRDVGDTNPNGDAILVFPVRILLP